MSRVITWSMAVVILVGAGVIFSQNVTGTAPSGSKEQMGSAAVGVDPAQLGMNGPDWKQLTAENPNGSFGAPPKVKARTKKVATAAKPDYAKYEAPTWEQWTKQPSGDFSAGAVATTPRSAPRVSYAR